MRKKIMTDVLIKIGWAILSNLMTEKFVGKMLVYVLRSIADKTGKKKLAEETVTAIAEALGVVES